MLQPSPQFLLTSAGWVITITTSIAPETGVTLSWENTCEPFGDLLPDFFKWTWRLLNFVREMVLNLFFIFLVLVGVGIWMQVSGGDSKETASRGALLLDISGVIVDKPDSSQRFSKLSRQLLGASSDRLQENSLFDIVNTIRRAKDDRNITGIVMDLKNFAGGDQPSMQYIGKALKEFRDSGKPVYAVGENYSRGNIISPVSPIKFGCLRKAWLICTALPPTVCTTNRYWIS